MKLVVLIRFQSFKLLIASYNCGFAWISNLNFKYSNVFLSSVFLFNLLNFKLIKVFFFWIFCMMYVQMKITQWDRLSLTCFPCLTTTATKNSIGNHLNTKKSLEKFFTQWTNIVYVIQFTYRTQYMPWWRLGAQHLWFLTSFTRWNSAILSST